MKLDLTWTITSGIAIAAIVSPIFTAMVNNHHQLNMKKLQLDHDERSETSLHSRQSLERLLSSISEFSVLNRRDIDMKKVMRAYYLSLPYVPENMRHDLSLFLQHLIDDKDQTDWDHTFLNKFVSEIKRIIYKRSE